METPKPLTDQFSTEQLEKQLQIKQLQVSALLEVTQAINNNLSSDKLFRIYEFILRAQINVKRLVVYIMDDGLHCICKYGISEWFDTEVLLDEIVKYNRITFFDNEPNPIFQEFDLIIPVYQKDKPLAFALLGEPEVDEYESMDEKIKFIRTITNIIVVAIENKRLFQQQLEQEKMKRELELAADVQSLLIPRDLPHDDKLDMAAVYLPHRDIGGDYYDYILLPDGRVIFCIADISGKGIAAAILMANFQAILRTLVKIETNFEDLIVTLNHNVTEITKGEKFITLFVGQYTPDTRELRYVNAGHNPPMLLTHSGFQALEDGCTILGMFEPLPSILEGRLTMPPDSILVNYTDGLTDLESEDGHNFTLDMLRDFMKKNRTYSMQVFNNLLLKSIMDFKGNVHFNDDISILSIRFL